MTNSPASKLVSAASPSGASIFARSDRTCLRNRNGTAANTLSVQFLYGIGGFLVRGHLNESESLAPPGIAIHDDLCLSHAAGLSKHFLQAFIRCAEWKIADIKFLSHDAP